MDSHPIQLVVFDLGRVLVRICNDWPEACRRAGVQWPEGARSSLSNPAMADLANRHDIGELDLQAFSEAASSILHMPADQIRAASHAYIHSAYPGAHELIDELNSRGIATACLSNTNETHWRLMSDPTHGAHAPLAKLKFCFASHLIHARKPDMAVYEHVERQTTIKPLAILFFDDVPENIQAAQRRGWNARHVDPAFENPIPHIREALRRYGVA